MNKCAKKVIKTVRSGLTLKNKNNTPPPPFVHHKFTKSTNFLGLESMPIARLN